MKDENSIRDEIRYLQGKDHENWDDYVDAQKMIKTLKRRLENAKRNH